MHTVHFRTNNIIVILYFEQKFLPTTVAQLLWKVCLPFKKNFFL